MTWLWENVLMSAEDPGKHSFLSLITNWTTFLETSMGSKTAKILLNAWFNSENKLISLRFACALIVDIQIQFLNAWQGQEVVMEIPLNSGHFCSFLSQSIVSGLYGGGNDESYTFKSFSFFQFKSNAEPRIPQMYEWWRIKWYRCDVLSLFLIGYPSLANQRKYNTIILGGQAVARIFSWWDLWLLQVQDPGPRIFCRLRFHCYLGSW